MAIWNLCSHLDLLLDNFSTRIGSLELTCKIGLGLKILIKVYVGVNNSYGQFITIPTTDMNFARNNLLNIIKSLNYPTIAHAITVHR